LRRLIEMTCLQRGIGLRQLSLAYLTQAVMGTVVVRLQCHCRLKQLACTGAVLAVQMAGLQGLLRAPQHIVQFGPRQHPAQTVLIEPEPGKQADQHQKQ
jgi:hypothetical protein